jgi:hypothetical protein
MFRRFSAALTPYSGPGGYVNVAAGEDQTWVNASYGGNFARLTEVKRAYNPTNLFRTNQNIPPAGPHDQSRVTGVPTPVTRL